jgi:flagellar hook-associated protein 1 FlgK
MSGSVLNIGVTGLNAAQMNLATTGHNVSNASTPGYHRQTLVVKASFPNVTGNGVFGSGVDVITVKRAYSEFLDSQVTASHGRMAYLEAYRAQITQVDNLLADPNSGLTPSLTEFFNTVHELGADPASAATRQGMLSGASALVGRFHAIEARLSGMFTAANSQIRDTVTSINSLAKDIAGLNRSVVVAEAASGLHAANDLRDQRDHLISQLNKLTGTTTVVQADGAVNVMIGNGQNLVIGDIPLSLEVGPSKDDARRLDIGYAGVGGSSIITPSLAGGELGAVLAFQRKELDSALSSLGRIATVLALEFNAQHRLGQDLGGMAGGDFFRISPPAVLGRASNTGNAALSATIADVTALTTSDYRLSYAGGNYTVTRVSDATSSTFAALPQTIDGVRIALDAGAPADGDSFLVQPTRAAARGIDVALVNGSQIAAAAPVRTAAGANNTGLGVIDGGLVNGPPPIDVNLLQPVSIAFTGPSTYSVTGTGTGNPTGLTFVSGAPITYNGWTVTITGAPKAGDTFSVTANTAGVSDNRNANALAKLQTSRSIGSTSSYQGAYSEIVAGVGAKTREVNTAKAAQESLVRQSEKAQQSMSGVNLDEEAANLIRYQQMYQANAKMIEVASRLFDSLLTL